jgi:hypothetical protein
VRTAAIKDYGLRASVKLGRYIKLTCENPRWFVVFALSRFNSVRALSRWLTKRPVFPEWTKFSESIFEDLDHAKIHEALESDGVHLNVNLPRHVVDEIYEFACSAEAFANGDPSLAFRVKDLCDRKAELPCELITGTFSDLSERLPITERLQNDPKLLDVASKYLNTQPVSSCRLWWSFPADSTREQQLSHAQGMFHYDPDVDFNALKFFFYITDVDDTCGPHVCVRGSHKMKRLGHKLTLLIGRSDEEIDRYYGSDNVLTITGPRGFGIAEDPMCFHKGEPPKGKPRLMLEVSYRLSA